MTKTAQPWWRTATVYQIYPKSFADSGNKGTGDLKGITQRLDYLQTLGVDAVWLTPVYASPMVDNGYDISDYYSINPDFGTMADFERLLDAAHQRGIRIIMDIVVNHTSTEHAWFQQALADKHSPYRDYYIWHDAVDGGEPNNWQSKFGGNAWQWHEPTQQYYLHLFAKEQADLNWENPQVREEVKQVIRFWADKGVDGFRLDVINLISKQQDFPNDPSGDGRRFYTDGPRVHEYLQEISADVFQQYGSVTVGEMSSTTLAHCQQYSAQDGKELSMVFNFHHLKVDYPNGEKWQLAPMDFLALKQLFSHWQQGLHHKGWGALFWCNHDQPRVVSRFGDDGVYRELSAKMLATSLHMMQGTPYVYQGEELGMTNPGFSDIAQYRDVESINMYRILTQEQGLSERDALAILAERSRDNARTPMQWDSGPHAGFTRGTPWIDVAENYPVINAAQALADPGSVFHYYRQLIALRKTVRVIADGDYTDLLPDDQALHVYRRQRDGQVLICLNNYSADGVAFDLSALSDLPVSRGETLLANYDDEDAGEIRLTGRLRPYESRVWLFS
ncbi:alpha,alpha-phosphotrehalase [Photobacterium halotolerans]|uniref:Alpha,alpha-phosphotrehalase n=1 Tax=Photobacterium halotolerans TaxID=265726 RepID=A0A0F5VFV0_9GAMM|nr:alpha,alpha-phosphotrehalase [Photobacterium halotolerans]KKD01009.1 trehalose-6-phosphate hydrolase [Photobacterium halotolerans]